MTRPIEHENALLTPHRLVKNIMNKHGVEIGGFAVSDNGKRVVVCATIDNLNKGAATQCLRKSLYPLLIRSLLRTIMRFLILVDTRFVSYFHLRDCLLTFVQKT